MARKSSKATFKERVAINDRLKEVITPMDGEMCVYKGNCSDQTVADELGVSKFSVQRVRLEMYGQLKAATSPRFEEMETLLTNLTHCYDDLKDRYNRLVTMLALNHVVDCKHLKIGEKQ